MGLFVDCVTMLLIHVNDYLNLAFYILLQKQHLPRNIIY